jgi:hypothetical protein
MATQSRAANGASRACPIDISEVRESDDELVVLVHLNGKPLELHVPRASVVPSKKHEHIPGFHADATPC